MASSDRRPVLILAIDILTVVAVLGSAGCDKSGAIEEELNDRLADQEVIYHFGCNEWGETVCDDSLYYCAADARDRLVADLASGEAVAIQIDSGCAEPGCFTSYFFVNADGSGSFYWEAKTDVVPSDCGDYCGWHQRSYDAGDLYDPAGGLHLRDEDDRDIEIPEDNPPCEL
jgi:hypothetical protein